MSSGHFIAEGDLVVQRAIDAGCMPDTVLCDPKRAAIFDRQVEGLGGILCVASAEIRREVTGLGVPLDAIGLFHRPALTDANELIGACAKLLVLDCIDNPSNVGAIVRTAVALGWDGILLDSSSSDPLSRRALRVSMGTALRVPFARVSDVTKTLALMRNSGFTTIGLTPAATAQEITKIKFESGQKRALVLGSERSGLSAATLGECSLHVKVPMRDGVDSLNVAAAAAVACYALGG